MSEHWAPVPGWENEYSVSSKGRVRSEPRRFVRASTAAGDTRRYTVRGRVLQPSTTGTVTLSRPGSRKTVKAARLAAVVFGLRSAA